jgi:hypothetical protein
MGHRILIRLFLLANGLVIHSHSAFAQPRDKFNCTGFRHAFRGVALFGRERFSTRRLKLRRY